MLTLSAKTHGTSLDLMSEAQSCILQAALKQASGNTAYGVTNLR